MTAKETVHVLEVVQMAWPHSNMGGDPAKVIDFWQSLLGMYPAAVVEGAVKELITAGREHAPPPGVVAKMCADRISDVPAFDEAWAEIDRLKMRWNPAFPGRESPAAELFSSPHVAAFALPVWRELCQGPAPGTNGYGTFYAQNREAYFARGARAVRDVALDAVGAPRGRGGLRPGGGAFDEVARRAIGGPT